MRNYLNFYGNLMRSSDSYLVNVLDKLEETGLFEDTLIVRTADHGEMGLAHGGLRQKNFNFYEEATRVPLVYSNPKLFPKPHQTEALVSHVDFLPTLASLAAAPKSARANWQGVDYSKLVLHPSTQKLGPGLRRLHLRRLPVRPEETVPTRNRRTTSSASAKGAGSWPSTTTSAKTRCRRSGRCTTSRPTRWSSQNLAYKGHKRTDKQEEEFQRLKRKLARVEKTRLKPPAAS